MNAQKLVATALLVILAGICSPANADMFPGSDGWHRWQTDEVGAVTDTCCFAWRRGTPAKTGCNLDGQTMSYSSGGDCAAGPGRPQYYVLMEGGKPRAIRVLSAACPVESATEIKDHGTLPAAENIAWFRDVIEDGTLADDIREEALFALVQSDSNLAFDYLDRILSANPPAGGRYSVSATPGP